MAKLVETSADTAYAEQAKRLANMRLQGDRLGLQTGPDVVAKAIGRAIIRKNPRTRYAIGLLAMPVVIARRLLPDVLIDPVMGGISRRTAPTATSAKSRRQALATPSFQVGGWS